MTIEARKYNLIRGIMQVSNERTLDKLEQVLGTYIESAASIQHLIKPMRKKLDVDELVREQNFQGVDKAKMDSLIKDIALEEPLENLLAEI